jgi:hypothetical protein
VSEYLEYYILERSAIEKLAAKQNIKYVTVGRDFQTRSRYTFERACNDPERDYLFPGLADMRAMRLIFRQQKGRYLPFWLPTYTRDYILQQGALTGSSTIRVQPGNLNLLDDRTRHIYFPRVGVAAQILSMTDNSTYYQLTISPALTFDLVATDVVCNLLFARFDSDALPMKRDGAQTWTTTIPYKELPREAPSIL